MSRITLTFAAVVVACFGLVVDAQANLITNGGFESPALGAGAASYSAPASWSTTGYGGYGNTGAFGATAPEGSQYGLVEIYASVSSSLSQAVTFPTTGQYTITYLDADRPSFGGISYDLDLIQSGTTSIAAGLTPTMGTTFAPRSFTFSAVAGAGTIRFFADGSSGANRAVFLDSVDLEFVPVPAPEPSSLALFGLGACALYVARRQRMSRKS